MIVTTIQKLGLALVHGSQLVHRLASGLHELQQRGGHPLRLLQLLGMAQARRPRQPPNLALHHPLPANHVGKMRQHVVKGLILELRDDGL